MMSRPMYYHPSSPALLAASMSDDASSWIKCEDCKRPARFIYVYKLTRDTVLLCLHCLTIRRQFKPDSIENYVSARIDNWHTL